MIRAAIFALLCVHLVAIELWCLGRLGGWIPDFAALVLVFALVDLRVTRALWVALPLALGRALLLPGGVGTQLWILLAAYCAVLPLRRFFFADRWQLQAFAGFALALLLSMLQAWVLSTTFVDPLGRGWIAWVLTGAIAPGARVVFAAFFSVTRARSALEVGA